VGQRPAQPESKHPKSLLPDDVIMNTTTTTVGGTALRRTAVVVVGALALTLATVSDLAWARPEPGPPATPSTHTQRSYPHCTLERLDLQLVRCDDLTGTGAPAPLTVPQAS
jgi:hypothetical protein